MIRFVTLFLSLLACLLSGVLSGCDTASQAPLTTANNAVPPFQKSEYRPGGDTTVSIKPFASFELPVANLPDNQKALFHAGKALANQPWVKAPTITTARDGLGPIYNARTCLMCHINGGKGFMPDNPDQALSGTLVRLSKPASDTRPIDPTLGVVAHPVYGDQLQTQSISLAHQLRFSQPNLNHDVPPEAYIFVRWQAHPYQYPDGNRVELRTPKLEFNYLGYGPLGDDTLMGLRVAPTIHGMGLIELIPQAAIDALADPEDADGNGISGRINQVWDAESQSEKPGRFGLKANKASLAHTVAGAFTNDVGITNALVPNQPCTALQSQCLNSPNGNDDNGLDAQGKTKPLVELPDDLLKLVVDFNRNIAPVARRNVNSKKVKQGRTLFYQVGCHQCHQPSYITADSEEFPHLANQTIWPYTDLLLHDLGPELADNRPDFLASGSEWRTPPLWGIGMSKAVNGSSALLHDGRARTVEEAILWHGGEAQSIKLAFTALASTQREALLKFVESL